MKIERIKCRVVDFPLEREFHPAWARGRNQPNLLMVLIEVETDTGITGIGAAHAGLEAAITIERFVAPYFIGQDPTYVERLMPVLRDTEILGAPVYCM
jgi:L-alanine-DL-glutamate epimerase-like enolase superfamily enzyme